MRVERATVLRFETPAASWRDAMPLGNGAQGAMVYGRIARERILLNHESLWSRGNTPLVPDTAEHLQALRRMLAEGRMEEAEHFFPSLWREAGFSAEPAHFLPGPDLCIEHSPSAPFESYRGEIDLQRGEATVQWREEGFLYKRCAFVSRTANMLVLRFSTDHPRGLRAGFSLEPHCPSDSRMYADFGGVTPPSSSFRVQENELHLTARFPDGTAYQAGMLLCGAEAKHRDGVLWVEGAPSVTILVRMAPQDSSLPCEVPEWPCDRDYDRLQSSHADAQRALMDRVELRLGSEQADCSCERMVLDAFSGEPSPSFYKALFDFGRYLLISSSTGAAALPANLQGIWNGDYRPAWTCGYFINENLAMSYWAALSGALPEAMGPFFDLIEAHMDHYRENARRMFGCRGILLPLFMSARSGRKHNPQPHVIYWTAGAGWIAQHFYDTWLYSGDEEFLRNRALPFLREAALFYEDFFTKGEDGCWVSSPSQSPENKPLGEFDGAGKLSICVNATMDFAVARELFGNLIEGARVTGQYADEVARWEAFLEKVPPYRILDDGTLAEWMDERFEENHHHRHLAHLYPLFPGREAGSGVQPDLAKACQRAVEKRRVIGMQDQAGWSLAHMAAVYARLGQGDQAIDCLHGLTRSCLGKNLFTYHNSDLDMGITQPLIQGMPAPFQTDANFGLVAAMIEMLLYSVPGRIILLPALPREWPEGAVNGLRCHGGIKVSIHWRDGGAWIEADLVASGDRRVEVAVGLGGPHVSVMLKQEAGVRLRFDRGELKQEG